MNIDELVRNFRSFILHAWPNVEAIYDEIDWDDDFHYLDELLESNWSFFVKRFVELDDVKKIQPYGYGAPYSHDNREGVTHCVICNFNGKKYPFRCFSNETGMYPPFDKVVFWDDDIKKLQKSR